MNKPLLCLQRDWFVEFLVGYDERFLVLFFLLGLDAVTASKRGPKSRFLAAVVGVGEDVLLAGRVDRLDVVDQ